MAQYIFSFLTTSLFMGLIILVVLILSALLPRAFSPKLRYAAWVVILIGLIIPFRPMFGDGLITLDVPYTPTVESGWHTGEVRNILSEPPIVGESGQGITTYEPAARPMRQTLSTANILVIAWAAVAVAILAYHVWRYIGFKKLIRRWGVTVTDEAALSVLQDVQAEKGIANKKIGLKKCDFVSTSMVVGFLNPIILLPDKNFDTDELELIFRHELIHYKRGDLFIKLLSVIAVSLNWFNPAVYLMSAAMQADCEASCDEAVIADVGGENRQFYAEIVMDMIGSKRTGGTVLSTCFYGSKNGIKKRMEAIMNSSGNVKKIAFSALVVLAILIVFAGSIFAFGRQSPLAQQPPQEAQYPTFQQPADNSEQQSTEQITSQQAREIATRFVGHGTVHSIIAFTEDGVLRFEVEIIQGATRYVVQIDGVSGNVINLSSYTDDAATEQSGIAELPGQQITPDPTLPQTVEPHVVVAGHPPQEPAPQPVTEPVQQPPATPPQTAEPPVVVQPPQEPAPQPVTEPVQQPTTTPQPQVSGRGSRPSNPSISLDRAIEIAYADIAARGINATFRTDSGMSWERGQWVWELEFRTHGERMPFIEFYINVDNGNIVKFEWDD